MGNTDWQELLTIFQLQLGMEAEKCFVKAKCYKRNSSPIIPSIPKATCCEGNMLWRHMAPESYEEICVVKNSLSNDYLLPQWWSVKPLQPLWLSLGRLGTSWAFKPSNSPGWSRPDFNISKTQLWVTDGLCLCTSTKQLHQLSKSTTHSVYKI